MGGRVAIIGLDCAAPELIFDRWTDELPNLKSLKSAGSYGRMLSCTPPITVPAWMCMMTGKDPGTLGVYGFRNRTARDYESMAIASSLSVDEPALWDLAGRRGKRTVALGVPLTYPPRAINGAMVSGIPAPAGASDASSPRELLQELERTAGPYLTDVPEFRSRDRALLLSDIRAMTAQRFRMARHLLRTQPWDLFVMVDMGPDRMHHAFWRYLDPGHPLHEPDSPFRAAIHDYYVFLDGLIGELLGELQDSDTVLVVSDHGAMRMEGGFCFNEWLEQEGYLKLKTRPIGPEPLTPDRVDWPHTRAWGEGGYYGRLNLNAAGREPQGIVPYAQRDALLDEIGAKLWSLADDHGSPMGAELLRPERIYRKCRGIAPDGIVLFGGLHWRSVGSVGHGTLWTRTNDTGPDDANHAPYGIFLMASVGDARRAQGSAHARPGGAELQGLTLYDVAPTVLALLGVEAPDDLGQPIAGAGAEAAGAGEAASGLPGEARSAYTAEEEAELARRLEQLGYL